MPDETIGRAGGIEAWPDQKAGVWRWSAYDGMNRRQGTGTSEENALAQARTALDLMSPMPEPSERTP